MLTSLAAIWAIGPWEILLVLLLVVVLFGARKLPELGKGIGESLKNLKKGLREASDEDGAESTENKDSTTRPT